VIAAISIRVRDTHNSRLFLQSDMYMRVSRQVLLWGRRNLYTSVHSASGFRSDHERYRPIKGALREREIFLQAEACLSIRPRSCYPYASDPNSFLLSRCGELIVHRYWRIPHLGCKMYDGISWLGESF